MTNLYLDVPPEVTTGWVGEVVEDSSSESSKARSLEAWSLAQRVRWSSARLVGKSW